MKHHDELKQLKDLISKPDALKQFVQSYFMTYDYEKKQWQIEDFDKMVKSVSEMKTLPGIKESTVFQKDVDTIVTALTEMKAQVTKEYYEKNSGLWGALTKASHYLMPASKLPDNVQALKAQLDERAAQTGSISSQIATEEKRGAASAVTGASSKKSPEKVFDMGELAKAIDTPKSPSKGSSSSLSHHPVSKAPHSPKPETHHIVQSQLSAALAKKGQEHEAQRGGAGRKK